MANNKIRYYKVIEQIDDGEKVKYIIDAKNMESAKTIMEEKAKKEAEGNRIISNWWNTYNKYEGGWKWFYGGSYMDKNHIYHDIHYVIMCMR